MLVGAYQEVMGNNHNLFGAPHEAHIHIDEEGFSDQESHQRERLSAPPRSARATSASLLHDGFRRLINRRVKDGELSEAEGAELAQFYESRYDAYTYLAVNGVKAAFAAQDRLLNYVIQPILTIKNVQFERLTTCMVTQRKPKASKYLTTPTRPVQVDRDRSVAGLLEKMEGTGFGGPPTRRSSSHLARHARR